MKLELKHLAPYLPYGLHIKHNHGARLIICGAFKKHNADDFFYYSLLNWMTDIKSIDAKPILRPLSDLTKEIEQNGEKFIPRDLIFGDSQELYKCKKYPLYQNYKIVQQLIAWHFDVFGLIDAGLAIDINTLKK